MTTAVCPGFSEGEMSVAPVDLEGVRIGVSGMWGRREHR